MKAEKIAVVVGGGLAGCECVLQLADDGFQVKLYEQKPLKFSSAHKNPDLSELVCSNSLGKRKENTANGKLISECISYKSHLIKTALFCDLGDGMNLIVDRKKFSQMITDEINNNPNIEIINQEVKKVPPGENVVIATGPLTGGGEHSSYAHAAPTNRAELYDDLQKRLGANTISLSDATCPIIFTYSIDKAKLKSDENGNLLLQLTEDEFTELQRKLCAVKPKTYHDNIECLNIPQAMSIENLAKKDLLKEQLPDRILTLRKENLARETYSFPEFKTQMSFSDQLAIIHSLPGLENAEFARYGRSHRNTFIDAPKCLDKNFSARGGTYIIGQLSGVDGYVPAISTGIVAARAIIARNNGLKPPDFGGIIGGFQKYITTPTNNYQPMVASFALVGE